MIRRQQVDSGCLRHPIMSDLPSEITDEQRRAAMLAVCQHAWTVDDARLLLDMLGLLP